MNNLSLPQLQNHFEATVTDLLKRQTYPSAKLQDAIGYSLAQGGKRIRPLLLYLSGLALGIELKYLEIPALAIECIHTYSLIHDDLPAMDNDDVRRGKPSCHKKFDEATAILAGDALQMLALEVLLNSPIHTDKQKVTMCKYLTQASGASGMVSGQALDIANTDFPSKEVDLNLIHELKTGALIQASIKMPLALCDNNSALANLLTSFAQNLGLAFQIQDDYLDVYGNNRLLGKPKGSDEEKNKFTYACLYPKANLESKYLELYDLAIDSLEQTRLKIEPLKNLILYLKSRTR